MASKEEICRTHGIPDNDQGIERRNGSIFTSSDVFGSSNVFGGQQSGAGVRGANLTRAEIEMHLKRRDNPGMYRDPSEE